MFALIWWESAVLNVWLLNTKCNIIHLFSSDAFLWFLEFILSWNLMKLSLNMIYPCCWLCETNLLMWCALIQWVLRKHVQCSVASEYQPMYVLCLWWRADSIDNYALFLPNSKIYVTQLHIWNACPICINCGSIISGWNAKIQLGCRAALQMQSCACAPNAEATGVTACVYRTRPNALTTQFSWIGMLRG
jgi:hypothetical protein